MASEKCLVRPVTPRLFSNRDRGIIVNTKHHGSHQFQIKLIAYTFLTNAISLHEYEHAAYSASAEESATTFKRLAANATGPPNKNTTYPNILKPNSSGLCHELSEYAMKP